MWTWIKRLIGTEQRGNLRNPSAEFLEAMGATRADSGVVVNETTALQYSPVWAAVNLIAKDAAKLPITVFRNTGEVRRASRTHPAHHLLSVRPNSFMTPYQFRLRLFWQAVFHGNGYALIRRDNSGRPVELIPLSPTRTTMDGPNPEVGQFEYTSSFKDSSTQFNVRREDMFHIKGIGNDVDGFCMFVVARNSFGMGLAGQEYTNRFFADNVFSDLVLSFPMALEGDTADNIRKSIVNRRAGLKKGWQPWIMEHGGEVKRIGNNDEAQLTDLVNFSIRDVANWFNVPPHRLGDTATTRSYNSLEEENKSYLDQALDPWLCNFEQESIAKLATEPEIRNQSIEVEFDRSRLQRANLSDRGEFLSKMISIGVLNRDEARAEIGRNPIPDGDGEDYLIPVNLAVVGQEPPMPVAPVAPVEEDEEEDLEASRAILSDALTTLVNRIYGQVEKTPTMGLEDLRIRNHVVFSRKLAPIRALRGIHPVTADLALARIFEEWHEGTGTRAAVSKLTREFSDDGPQSRVADPAA